MRHAGSCPDPWVTTASVPLLGPQSTRERLDMLTAVARTASEARQQQQARLDEQDTALRAARDEAERTTAAHRLHLKREYKRARGAHAWARVPSNGGSPRPPERELGEPECNTLTVYRTCRYICTKQ